nr:hypothetical protein [Psychrobacter sp. PraFG1]UNK05924.1 hypothetical protein MN210_04050 [Psychrobacter sp. PraFG1]
MTNNELIDKVATQQTSPGLVPKGFTIGLAVFSLILSVSGYVFRALWVTP